jgi:restriction system protein
MVLKESGRPMHIDEITRMLIHTGLWITSEKDPASFLRILLYTDIRDRGDKSVFVKTAPDTFTFREIKEIENDLSRASKTTEEDPKTKTSEPESYYYECVRMVLEKSGGGKPMHFKEITKIAQDLGLLSTHEKNPEKSMRFQVKIAIKQLKNQGVQPCLIYWGNGFVGLSKFIEGPSVHEVPSWSDSHSASAQLDSAETGEDARPGPASDEDVLNHRSENAGNSLANFAEKVLWELKGQPMHFSKIAKRALENGLAEGNVKIAESSMYIQIYNEIKRHLRRRVQPRFIPYGRGIVGLSKFNVSLPVDESPGSSEVQLVSAQLNSEETAKYIRPLPVSASNVFSPISSNTGYYFADCAEKVLLLNDGQPMHFRQITDIALKIGWLKPCDKNLYKSMMSQLSHEFKRQKRHGVQTRFVLHGHGFVSLSKSYFNSPVHERHCVSKANPASALQNFEENAEDAHLGLACASDGLNSLPSFAGYSLTDCAVIVLSEFGKGEPMHYISITNIALNNGLFVPGKKKPEYAMYSFIKSEIKRHEKIGVQPRFVLYRRGFVGLSKFNVSPPVHGISCGSEVKPESAVMDSAEAAGELRPDLAFSREVINPNSLRSGYSFTDCAEKVLLKFSERQSMHYKEITEIALENGWLVSRSKSPWELMINLVTKEIRRQEKKGVQPRFVLPCRGFVGLTKFSARSPLNEASCSFEVQPASEFLDSSETDADALPDPSSVGNFLIPSSDNAGFSFTDLAYKVLSEFSEGQPMHYREIAKKALENGLLASAGKMTEVSIYTQVISEITRHQKMGVQPKFILHGSGFVGLALSIEKRGMSSFIVSHIHKVRNALREKMLSLNPAEFEELICQLLTKMGFETDELTKLSTEEGFDVRGTLTACKVIRIKMAVQVRKCLTNIQAPHVQMLRGSLGSHEQGLIITAGSFTEDAVTEALQSGKTPVALMNGEQLARLMIEHQIGVRRSVCELFELDE